MFPFSLGVIQVLFGVMWWVRIYVITFCVVFRSLIDMSFMMDALIVILAQMEDQALPFSHTHFYPCY